MKKQTQTSRPKQKNARANRALYAFAAAGCSFALIGTASAQVITYSGELDIPYGHSYRDENTPYNPSTRDKNGNRVIIDGRRISDTTLSGGLSNTFFNSQSGVGTNNAIGNQLNVITNGNWNTVIINNTQINNGNQSVTANQTSNPYNPPIAAEKSNQRELNGEINLDD